MSETIVLLDILFTMDYEKCCYHNKAKIISKKAFSFAIQLVEYKLIAYSVGKQTRFLAQEMSDTINISVLLL